MTWMEAARLTAVERMPAVSQVSVLPAGVVGKMQARQAVRGTVVSGKWSVVSGARPLGRMFMVAA